MAVVRVYQYDYYDPQLKRERRSLDFATSDSIMEQGATIIAESQRLVDEDLLDEHGVIAARDLPPREDVGRAPTPRWMRGEDRRVGPR